MTAPDPASPLKALRPRHEFLIAIDSDGSVFDTMVVKHRDCLCPAMIECFGLEPVAQAARECMDFADMFSKTRGANRHQNLKRILTELLPSHPLVKARGFEVPQLPYYFTWVGDPASALNRDGLVQAIARATGPAHRELELALAWNDQANRMMEQVVTGVPPFPYVRECFEKMQGRADVIVVSTAPQAVLTREWREHGMARYVAVIAGQDMGAKRRSLEYAAKDRYNKDRAVMIGDAPGDLEAARANDILFYPIMPGHEATSWRQFHDVALDRFFNGTYTGRYERELIEQFDACLPERPPWGK